jgi:hypothetical protein
VYWKLVGRNDVRARILADRHYSRQSIGSPHFTPPGNAIVLLGLDDDALWVSHRPDPKANLAVPRADGFSYWDNPYFRNESGNLASDMIKEAIAITLWLWPGDLPTDGFHSFVDSRMVKPTIRRGRPVYGYCFQKAGFYLWPDLTKDRKLHRYVLPLSALQAIEAIEPRREQLQLLTFP